MLILLYGPDSYHREKRLTHILSVYRQKHAGLSLRHFDFSDTDSNSDSDSVQRRNTLLLADLSVFCGASSLFESVKLGIIKNPFLPEFLNTAKNMASEKSTTLILVSDDAPPAPFSFLLKPPVRSESFSPLSATALIEFIKKEALARGLSLSPENISLLAEEYGQDLWGIINDLERRSLANDSSSPARHPEFFSLIHALADRQIGRRLSAYCLLTFSREEPAKIFNLLAYQYGIDRRRAAALDLDIKSGRLEYPEAILSLLL